MNEKGSAKDHDDAGGFDSGAWPGLEPHPNCRSVAVPVPAGERLKLEQRRQRWRDLWLREIDAATEEQLCEIGREQGLEPPNGNITTQEYRDRIKAHAQLQLLVTAEQTPEERHRRVLDAIHPDGAMRRMAEAQYREMLSEADPPGSEEIDEELEAMRECALQLAQLQSGAARRRVLDYLRDRYGRGDG